MIYSSTITLVVLFGTLVILEDEIGDYSILNRDWGFDNLTYLPNSLSFILFVLLILIVIPKSNRLTIKTFELGLKKLFLTTPSFIKGNFFLFIVTAILFYFFRVKYDFLGDYNIRLMQVVKGDILYTEYLTMKTLQYYLFLFKETGFSEHQLFVIYSCLMGGIYAVISRKICIELFAKRNLRYGLFALLLFTPLVLIFCGYVEVYSTPSVCMMAYCLLLIKTIKAPIAKNLFFCFLVLLLSIALHLLNVSLIPSFILLIVHVNDNLKRKISSIKKWKIYLMVSLISVTGFILVFFLKSEFTLPLYGIPEKHYFGFFTVPHFWELFNGFILGGGILVLIYFPIIIHRILKMRLKIEESVFILAFLGPFFILLVTNLQRGSADWDLMCYPFPLLFVSVTYFLSKHSGWNSVIVNYILSTSIAFNLINMLSWIYIHNGNKSIDKISDMLRDDPGTYYTKLSSKIQLAVIFDINGLKNEAENMLIEDCSQQKKEINGCLMLLKNYINNKDEIKAIDLAEQLLRKDPFNPFVYSVLLDLYNNEKSYDDFLRVSRSLFNALNQRPDIFLSSYPRKRYIEIFHFLLDVEKGAGNLSKVKEIELQIKRLESN